VFGIRFQHARVDRPDRQPLPDHAAVDWATGRATRPAAPARGPVGASVFHRRQYRPYRRRTGTLSAGTSTWRPLGPRSRTKARVTSAGLPRDARLIVTTSTDGAPASGPPRPASPSGRALAHAAPSTAVFMPTVRCWPPAATNGHRPGCGPCPAWWLETPRQGSPGVSRAPCFPSATGHSVYPLAFRFRF